jgi:hypothetical protein
MTSMTDNTDTMIVFGPEFNPDEDTIFTKPKVNPSGGKNVGILYGPTKKSTYLSTPLMMTWGINEYVDDRTGKKTYDLALQFPREQDSNYSNDTAEFLTSLQAFEAKIKADAIVNSKEWMNKAKLTESVVDALWTPMLRYPKDENGDPDTSKMPTLKVKVPYWEGVFKTEMYDMNERVLFPDPTDDKITPLTFIQKNTNIALVIQNGGIWFANGKFGTTWKMVQAVVQPKATLRGKCHIHLGASEKARLTKATEETSDADDQTQAVDSDEDIDQSEIVSEVQQEVKKAEVEVPPKKKVVKKKVKKAEVVDEE